MQLWPIRYALSLPAYANNPAAAVDLARKELVKLASEFLARKGKTPDFVYHLPDLDSIDSRDKLAARIQLLRELDSFLDERISVQSDSSRHQANVLISTIPLFLGVTKQNSARLYAVMTAPGLISIWGRAESGEFVLKGLSEGD